ncbi:GNAT family N-acetyltransferase [Bradyrhizobium sp. SYSU BS000235]|uniref:GNAT family N-acetyltransferase n=1 Tax=Bradyrhizobium sp. SYSU BS000235 TaxID=3411332 RepID=UPI003C76097B
MVDEVMDLNLHSAEGRWRPMAEVDLPAASALAASIHPAFPEDDAVFVERLALYPAGCGVFDRGGQAEAYVVSHPWRRFEAPPLNSLLGALPASPSTFYIHDLALSPAVRNTGAAAQIVAWLAEYALAEGIRHMSLIAVNGSAGFWQRQGFTATQDRTLARTLDSYEGGAQYMVRDLF